jgi:hypothetical protein
MSTVKEDLLKFVVELPDDSTIEDIEYYLYVKRKIEIGREAARRGEVITQEEFKKRMNEWSEKSLGRSLL